VGSIVSAALGASAAGVVKESRTVCKIVSLEKGRVTHVPDSVETCIHGSKCKSLDKSELPFLEASRYQQSAMALEEREKCIEKSSKMFEKW